MIYQKCTDNAVTFQYSIDLPSTDAKITIIDESSTEESESEYVHKSISKE